MKNPGFTTVAVFALSLVPAFGQRPIVAASFVGAKAGVETNVGGVRLCCSPSNL